MEMLSTKLVLLLLLCALLATPGVSWKLQGTRGIPTPFHFLTKKAFAQLYAATRPRNGGRLRTSVVGGTNTHLEMASTDGVAIDTSKQRNEILSYSRLALRSTVISWWIQIILTVISSVILTFANTVRQSSNAQSFWTSGFAFSSIGVIISYVSALMTWKNSRMCKRLILTSDEGKAKLTMKKAFHFSVTLSLVGMFVTLLGAEQIVGTLASKVLSLQGIQPIIGTIGTQNSLQALDIFLVQANTNTLLALFSPVVCYLFLQTPSFLKSIDSKA